MGLSTDAERAIAQLIERRGIHSDLRFCLPVPIRQVVRDEGWIVQHRERIAPLYGYAVVCGHIQIMVISADIAPTWQRHTMAHEMGHVLNGDPSSIHLCNSWPWMSDRHERQASIAAAKILIPDAALVEIATVSEIATLCDVPVDLVELRIAEAKGTL